MEKKDTETITIPIFEILLVIGIIFIILGILAPMQRIQILETSIWFDPNLAPIFWVIGIGFISGYVTKKILPNGNGTFMIGFLIGIIGIIVAICIRISKTNRNDNKNKYEDLRKLAELKQNGTITEEEFNIEKSKILNLED